MSNILSEEVKKNQREIQQALRNHGFERTEHGIFLTKAKAEIAGFVRARFLRHPLMQAAFDSKDPEKISHTSRLLHAAGNLLLPEYEQFALDEGFNKVVNESLDHILDTEFSGGAAVTARYLMLATSDSTPAAAWTAANYVTTYGVSEFVDYDEAARPGWLEDGVSSQAITNSPTTSDGEFTCNNVAAADLYLALLINASTKSTNPGVAGGSGDATALLSAAKRFDSAPRSVQDNDKVHLTYSLAIASTT